MVVLIQCQLKKKLYRGRLPISKNYLYKLQGFNCRTLRAILGVCMFFMQRYPDYSKVCVNLQTYVKTELLSMEVIFMSRRKDSPQKATMRGFMRNYLKNNDISIKIGIDVKEACY